MFEGTVESGKEHKPPRAMPQLMEYFKAIKVRHARGPFFFVLFLSPTIVV